MKRLHRWLVPALLPMCLGCTPWVRIEPDPVQPPTLGLTPQDRFSAAARAPSVTPVDLNWWRRFDDPVLADWVQRALAGSSDIGIARERVAQARALLQQARAARGPRLDGQAEIEARLRRESNQRRALQPAAAFALDYDLDLWGGLRLAQEAAEAGVLRSRDLLQAQRLETASLAARTYLEWRLALHEHRLLADTAGILAESLRLARIRVEAGLSPVLERERAESELATTRAAQAAAAVRAGQAHTALQVLAGERPLVAVPPLVEPAAARDLRPLPALAGDAPLVQPLDLLRLRPDLRAAEHALFAAAAQVGVAEAALRPRLRLPGVLAFGAAGAGGGAFELVRLAVAGLVEAPLLDGGERRAGLGAARSQAREAEWVYRRTLLQALGQVEDALLAREGALARVTAAEQAVAAARSAQEQARTLHRVGLADYLDVVDAQRSALASGRLLLQSRAEAAAAAVRAFEAMGLVPAGAGGEEGAGARVGDGDGIPGAKGGGS